MKAQLNSRNTVLENVKNAVTTSPLGSFKHAHVDTLRLVRR